MNIFGNPKRRKKSLSAKINAVKKKLAIKAQQAQLAALNKKLKGF